MFFQTARPHAQALTQRGVVTEKSKNVKKFKNATGGCGPNSKNLSDRCKHFTLLDVCEKQRTESVERTPEGHVFIESAGLLGTDHSDNTPTGNSTPHVTILKPMVLLRECNNAALNGIQISVGCNPLSKIDTIMALSFICVSRRWGCGRARPRRGASTLRGTVSRPGATPSARAAREPGAGSG
jgi:hypothetical protein